jgi:hypothetical protein
MQPVILSIPQNILFRNEKYFMVIGAENRVVVFTIFKVCCDLALGR